MQQFFAHELPCTIIKRSCTRTAKQLEASAAWFLPALDHVAGSDLYLSLSRDWAAGQWTTGHPCGSLTYTAITSKLARPTGESSFSMSHKNEGIHQRHNACVCARFMCVFIINTFCVLKGNEHTATWRRPCGMQHEVKPCLDTLPSWLCSDAPLRRALLLYPSGNKAKKQAISLYLCVPDYQDLEPGWSRRAHFTLSVVDQKDGRRSHSCGMPVSFAPVCGIPFSCFCHVSVSCSCLLQMDRTHSWRGLMTGAFNLW